MVTSGAAHDVLTAVVSEATDASTTAASLVDLSLCISMM